jgi:hypothetical protein
MKPELEFYGQTHYGYAINILGPLDDWVAEAWTDEPLQGDYSIWVTASARGNWVDNPGHCLIHMVEVRYASGKGDLTADAMRVFRIGDLRGAINRAVRTRFEIGGY